MSQILVSLRVWRARSSLPWPMYAGTCGWAPPNLRYHQHPWKLQCDKKKREECLSMARNRQNHSIYLHSNRKLPNFTLYRGIMKEIWIYLPEVKKMKMLINRISLKIRKIKDTMWAIHPKLSNTSVFYNNIIGSKGRSKILKWHPNMVPRINLKLRASLQSVLYLWAK